MDQKKLNIVYDWPLLRSHTMEVSELAPALLALANLVKEAAYILNKWKTNVSVKVDARFREWSFGVELLFSQETFQATQWLLTIFNSNEVNSVLNIAEILGYIWMTMTILWWGSLISLVKDLHGKKIQSTELKDGNVVLQIEWGVTINVTEEIYHLYENRKVRQHLSEAISEPLWEEGIDLFVAKDGENEIRIDKEDACKLAVTPPDSEVYEEKENMKLKIITVSFIPWQKWKVTDWKRSFFVAIQDQQFNSEIDQDRKFGKNDQIEARVLTRRTINQDQTEKSEYIITEVYKHISAPSQMQIHDAEKGD